MDVWMADGGYEFDFWRREGVVGRYADVELPAAVYVM